MGNMSSLSSSFIISTSRIDDFHLNQEGKLIKIIITINGYQVIKINKIRNVIFGLSYGEPSSAYVRPKMGCSPS